MWIRVYKDHRTTAIFAHTVSDFCHIYLIHVIQIIPIPESQMESRCFKHPLRR